MEMNEAQRRDFARRVKALRVSRYRGSRKAAYTAADVNSATWSRAEDALTIKEGSLVAIVQTLWPETGGDWQLIDPPLEDDVTSVDDRIHALGLSPDVEAQVLRLIAEDRAPVNDSRDQGTA